MDKPVAGSLAGLIAGMIIGVVSHLLFSLRICGLCLIAIGGGFFTRNMLPQNAEPVWTILGWIDHMLMAAVFGIVLAYIFHFTGRDYAYLKGAFYGAFLWLFNIAFLSPLAGYIPRTPQPFDLYILLGYHLLFGIVATGVLLRLQRRLPE